MNNIAFIDGQNLYMGTLSSDNPWKIDFARFRIYLLEKYKIVTAYFYIGYEMNANSCMIKVVSQENI